LGLEGAKARAKDLVTTAEDALTGYGAAADILRQAARFVIARKN
jgi:farnesyl diphosphate synthase